MAGVDTMLIYEFLFANEKSNVRLLPGRYLVFQDTYTEAQEF